MTTIFLTVSMLAVVAGGLLSAFTARRPSRAMAWLSAYLVLVVGCVQFGLVHALSKLGEPHVQVLSVALILYNFGNAQVIVGTVLKTTLKQYLTVVRCGGLCIGAAMVLLLYAVKNTAVSGALVTVMVLALVILISMPIGLVLSAKKRKGQNNATN